MSAITPAECRISKTFGVDKDGVIMSDFKQISLNFAEENQLIFCSLAINSNVNLKYQFFTLPVFNTATQIP